MSIHFLLLTAAPPLAGVALGYLSGGRLSGFRDLRIRALWLVWLAAGIQFAQHYTAGALRVPLLAAVFAVVLTWLAVNLRHWPAAIRLTGILIVLGASLNGLAIAANGRMPYDATAAAGAGIHAGAETTKNVAADGETRLARLGDTMPLKPLHTLISPGDILIAGGACALVLLTMRRHRRKEENHDPIPEPATPDPGHLHPGHPRDPALHDRRSGNRGQLTATHP
ncbi:hypothetical protein GCM10010168_21920 [Actinoplanes ianthinogenes]|uniref:DUF5317 domain-containing protein n=1 Tax=Actinoplanes ianthinogenes TaxID=122358 RepID=A0ABM7M885_9ACTN|nr:DUF5317 family protein [Actinoplanes ianthinogenes]BCJ47833.1 hypothetical protein Aiant_84900 [Actinoplanes ianthinogenes]GGR04483.1 hypothetical protein GCM10010168_21920 [Actinoplanes ianthinogenes]